MAGAIAQTLQDLLIDAAPQPDLIIPHLHALEMRRAQVLEMARALHAMEGRTEEEKRMYAIMESTLGHEEQARRFVAIDILWRCLAVELRLVQKDLTGAEAALKHFEPTRQDEPRDQTRLALFKGRERKRMEAVAAGTAYISRQDTRHISLLSLNYVAVIAPLLSAMERHVDELERRPFQSESQASESLPTPSSTSPAVARVESIPRSSSSHQETRDVSRSASPGQKRTREERSWSTPLEPQEARRHNDETYEQWAEREAKGLKRKAREDSDPESETAEETELDEQPPPKREPSPPKALGNSLVARTSLLHADDFSATQPPMALAPPVFKSKLQLAAKANSERLAQKVHSVEPQRIPSASVSAPRPVAPTPSGIIMPPPAIATDTSQSTNSNSSTSQDVPPAAQAPPIPANTSQPSSYVLVPATQSSNESAGDISAVEPDAGLTQLYTQAMPLVDSQEEDPQPQVDSFEAEAEPARETSGGVDQEMAALQSFGELERQATEGPDDEEAMRALAEYISDS